MFPARFVFLESLPRAPGGKLDRLALRALAPARASRPGGDHVGNGADPDRALSPSLPQTAPEWHQTLVEWNQTEAEYPKDKTVHRLFEEWAARAPEAVAVEFEGSRLTYGQLNERANRLARHLTTRGVGPEILVSMCLERSLEMVVAVLAIFKAGGAYLPLDPTHPLQRLRSIREEAGARLVLTQKGIVSELAEGAERIDLDSEWAQIARESSGNLACPATPGNLAYVIYTSGSTGKPKGVEIEHGSLTNHVWATVKQFGIRPGDRLLQFSALTFDASVQEIFATLGAGATLVLRSEEMIAGVATFLARCREWSLTILSLPTAYWHEVVAAASEEGLSLPASLRLVAVGGEKALPERFAQWRVLAGGRVRFVNGYGPTEATITATRWEPDPASQSPVPPILPIGRPIANTRAYVLDASRQPVPVGVIGELYIGGVCVARGYRNRPDLTAERFIPDPFGGGQQKLYRTGDRVRWGSDGLLEYLGRADGQIKLRGYRVELGEVEAALRGIDGVREAVVRAREDVPGQLRLVAYVVPDRMPGPSIGDLRRLLKETLPEYMVPSHFVLLDDLPLSKHGKLDLSALPPPEFARPEVDDAYREPGTPVEAALSEIWTKVLRVDRVGVDDDFFELGGHSLLATKVISRIRDAFHVELPLRDFYLNPTVAGLALAVARRQAERVAPDEMERLLAELEPPRNQGNRRWTLTPIGNSAMGDLNDRVARLSPEARVTLERRLQEKAPGVSEGLISRRVGDGPAALSFGQERLWLLDRLDPGKAVYNIPRALRIRGRLDVEALGRALDTIQERHEVLRSAFPAVDGSPVQVVGPARSLSLPVVDLGAFAGSESRGGGAADRWKRKRGGLSISRWDPCCGRRCCAWPRRSTFCWSTFTTSSSMAGPPPSLTASSRCSTRRIWKAGRRPVGCCRRSSTRILPSGNGSGCAGKCSKSSFPLEAAARGCSGRPGVAHQPLRALRCRVFGARRRRFRSPDRWPTGSGGSGSARGRRCS